MYLKDYASVTETRTGIERYFRFYNQERLHQSLNYRTPAALYRSRPVQTPERPEAVSLRRPPQIETETRRALANRRQKMALTMGSTIIVKEEPWTEKVAHQLDHINSSITTLQKRILPQ